MFMVTAFLVGCVSTTTQKSCLALDQLTLGMPFTEVLELYQSTPPETINVWSSDSPNNNFRDYRFWLCAHSIPASAKDDILTNLLQGSRTHRQGGIKPYILTFKECPGREITLVKINLDEAKLAQIAIEKSTQELSNTIQSMGSNISNHLRRRR